MKVPPLSEASASRLEAALADAVDAVESDGVAPDDALAKSAAAHGLPLSHLPMAVKALNTGRAARQLFAGDDPWEKAASFPLATVEGVARRLSDSSRPDPAKAAGDADFDRPPEVALPPAPDLARLANLLGVPEEPKAEKCAGARPEQSNVREVAVVCNRILAEMEAVSRRTSDALYAGASKLARARHGEAARFAFDRLDARRGPAAAEPDLATPPDHPLVKLAGLLARVRGLTKAAAVPPSVPPSEPPAPAVLRPAAPGTAGLGRSVVAPSQVPPRPPGAGPAVLPVSPLTDPTNRYDETVGLAHQPGVAGVLGGAIGANTVPGSYLYNPTIRQTRKLTFDPALNPHSAIGSFAPGAPIGPAVPDVGRVDLGTAKPAPTGAVPAAAGKTGGDTRVSPPEKVALGWPNVSARVMPGPSQLVTGPIFERMRKADELRTSAQAGKIDQGITQAYGAAGPETKLPNEMDRLGDQEAINALLASPHLQTADPAVVVQHYRQLSGLAPTVMRNPAVAQDFVRRAVQTGPLSYLDLGHLAKIERDVAGTRHDRDN
jgi:hypothetical protein